MLRTLAAAWLVLLGACADPAPEDQPLAEAPDAGAPAVVVAPPAPPAPPEAPRLRPCPPGWRELPPSPDEAAACDPWPEKALDCPGGQAHFPGRPGCEEVGSPCPADGWPAQLPPGAPVIHVRAGAASGGDGSRALPLSSLAQAAAGAAPGTVIALAAGRYEEAVELPAGVALVGACASGTTISPGPPVSQSAAVTCRSADASLAEVTVTGERAGVRVEGAGASLGLRSVVIDGPLLAGLRVTRGGRLQGERVVVRAVRPWPVDGSQGRCVFADYQGQAELRWVALESCREAGVLAMDAGTLVRLADASVRKTLARASDGKRGQGLAAYGGGAVEGERVAVEESRTDGLYSEKPGSRVAVRWAAVRATLPCPDDPGSGRGGLAFSGGRIEVSLALFSGNRTAALAALGAGTAIAVEDAVIRDTAEAGGTGMLGIGAFAWDGASLSVRRAVVERNRDSALLVMGPGSTAAIEDVTARLTRSEAASGQLGLGFQSGALARATLSRVALVDNRHCGLLVDEEAEVEATDLRVEGTLDAEASRRGGRGVWVQGGGKLTLSRASLARNRGVGLGATGAGTRVAASDFSVRDGLPQEADCLFGRSVQAQLGASLSLRRALVERAQEVGVGVLGDGTRIEAEDLEILDAWPRRCPESPERFGFGALAVSGGELDFSRFRIARAARVGLYLGRGALRLKEGEVRDCAVGVNLSDSGAEPEEVLAGISLAGNGTPVAAEVLPLPEPALPDLAP